MVLTAGLVEHAGEGWGIAMYREAAEFAFSRGLILEDDDPSDDRGGRRGRRGSSCCGFFGRPVAVSRQRHRIIVVVVRPFFPAAECNAAPPLSCPSRATLLGSSAAAGTEVDGSRNRLVAHFFADRNCPMHTVAAGVPPRALALAAQLSSKRVQKRICCGSFRQWGGHQVHRVAKRAPPHASCPHAAQHVRGRGCCCVIAFRCSPPRPQLCSKDGAESHHSRDAGQ